VLGRRSLSEDGKSGDDSWECGWRLPQARNDGCARTSRLYAILAHASGLSDGCDDLVLISAHAGLVRIQQNGHAVELAPQADRRNAVGAARGVTAPAIMS
jgi:hypothetical protein